MKQGIVKFFNNEKGFGFITITEFNRDIFVHVTGLIDEISQNDQVVFDVEDSRKGLRAVNVKLI
ncbi:cold-shock protein [Aureibacter tunicatorum]|uniref:CspA family cold shock protein n=2 Tax=Aureibacter tunicatorum TaxID=866807 RepID=A0AAE3XTR6_9BACT|nr:cold shock domain-containing protein [Aureibacter tunicatorum]MDR6241519.1 CspA family cold shock protein [Aureibacter tunicatorum]BDD07023.1 cold-shock protein [Aureibacter tunicatorum]